MIPPEKMRNQTSARVAPNSPTNAAGMLMLGIALLLFGCRAPTNQEMKMKATAIPQLRKVGQVAQLFVDDKPFLALGGELRNSTASDLDVLEGALAKCQRMNLNTIMLPVYWDLIEPAEGKFDFTLVRGAIDRARAHHLHLVFLWFGTWKNSMSCYAPSWVKRDTARFERVKTSEGETLEIISPQGAAANDADAKAFAALLRWTRDYDSEKQTVVMVQVENEVGIIPEAMDHSAKSEEAYRNAVPQTLMSLAAREELGPEVNTLWEKAGRKTSGTWSEVFGSGPQGEEIFSAWQIASFVEHVAAAGKKEYPLPMYANAALIRPGYEPGKYPSAGPLPHLLEVWRAAAPSLSMICPDIYFPNFMEWCQRYVRDGNPPAVSQSNPLFIPEMAATARACGNAVYGIAKFSAIGVGPFSIENVDEEKERRITNCYQMLSGMSDLILKSQQEGTAIGLSPQIGFDWTVDEKPQRGELGGVVFEAAFDRPPGAGDAQATTLPTLGSGRWEAPPSVPRTGLR